MSTGITLAAAELGMETYITMVVFGLAVIFIIYWMFHTYHAGKGQYGLETLTPEEQARVREDMQSGFHGGRVFLCRDGVVINGTKVVRYRDIVWIRLLNVTYTAALVPVMSSSRIILYDRRGKQFDLEFGAALKESLQSKDLKPLNPQEFLNMLYANAPWSYLGKQGEKVSFSKKKQIVQEKYDRIMREKNQVS